MTDPLVPAPARTRVPFQFVVPLPFDEAAPLFELARGDREKAPVWQGAIEIYAALKGMGAGC